MLFKSVEEFYFIHSYPELALGKLKRDLCPALQKCTSMMSCVSGSEYISKNCVGRFRFIFLVCSHDNVNGRQTSAGNAGCHIFSPGLAFGHSKRYLLRFAPSYRTPIRCSSYEKIQNDRHTHSYTNFQIFVLVHHRFMVIIWLNCYSRYFNFKNIFTGGVCGRVPGRRERWGWRVGGG